MSSIVQLNIDVPLLCRLHEHATNEPGTTSLVADVLNAAIENIRRAGFSISQGMPLQTFASGDGANVGIIVDADDVWTAFNPGSFTVSIDLSSVAHHRQTLSDHLAFVLNNLSEYLKAYDKGATPTAWKIKNISGHVVLVVPASALNCLRAKPLKFFEVTVVRQIVQMQVMTLEAATEEQAKSFALNQPAHHFDWKTAEVLESPSIFGSKDLSEELLDPAALAAVVDATEAPKG
jgi:hypothetical protein